MRKPVRFWLTAAAAAVVAVAPVALTSGVVTQAAASTSKPTLIRASTGTHYGSRHMHINCAESSAMCTEVGNSRQVFGYYVGHDEPSMEFNSNTAGSGNHLRYNLILPKDPPNTNVNAANKSFAFELSGAEWLGMAMCDTQSYPETTSTCTPDSDNNIHDPAVSPKHVGQAYTELQFYPPGWVQWPTWQVAVGASSLPPCT